MTDVESTWAARDLPVLVSAYRRFEAGERNDLTQMEAMRQELSLSYLDFVAAMEALAGADPPYIEVETAGGWNGERAGSGYVSAISERARRELGAWPSGDSLVEQLAAALSRAADEEREPGRKSRLREAADVLSGMARDIAVNVLSAKIGQV
jgi:hypothetical protein